MLSKDHAPRTGRGPRAVLGIIATAAMSLGIALVPATANAASTYTVEVRATWTNLKGTTTKPVTADVKVVALGSYAVTGSVQICEDTRCYGNKVKLSTSGTAKVSAIVPRDSSGVKSLQVKYYGDGYVVVPGYSGATKYQGRSWQSDQTEASIATYGTTTQASLASSTVKQGEMVKIPVKVLSKQPKTMFQYKNGKKETLPLEPVAGMVTVYKGKTELKNLWVKANKGTIEFKAIASRLGKGKHTLTVKFQGSNIHAPSQATVTLTVK